MNQFTDGRHEWITEYDETASAGWNEWSSKHDGRIKQIVEALIDSTNFRLKHFLLYNIWKSFHYKSSVYNSKIYFSLILSSSFRFIIKM